MNILQDIVIPVFVNVVATAITAIFGIIVASLSLKASSKRRENRGEKDTGELPILPTNKEQKEEIKQLSMLLLITIAFMTLTILEVIAPPPIALKGFLTSLYYVRIIAIIVGGIGIIFAIVQISRLVFSIRSDIKQSIRKAKER